MGKLHVRLKRAYELAAPDDGYRVLIDRLWPRGLSRQEARLDDWDKHLSPSPELRRWFGHEPGRFDEFRRRYTLVYSRSGHEAQRCRCPRGSSAARAAHESKMRAEDELAAERWIDEGGRVAPQMPAPRRSRPHVLIAGAGVAGLETLLALRALAADRLDVTVLAPELMFVNRSMSAEQPFKVQRRRGIRVEDVAAEFGATWHRGAVDHVVRTRHRVFTREGRELQYDMLVLALGAHAERECHSAGGLTYRGGHDGPNYRLLLHHLRTGRVNSVAFVKPMGASWPLPLYDLALMTAGYCAAHDRPQVELSLITPEHEPLEIFGARASEAIRNILRESGVALHTGSYGRPSSPGRLEISPGHRSLAVDRIVTEPRLVGPSLRGIPSGHEGFIRTDAHGRVCGLDDVFAAGDATAFPIKQGGLAAQQADAVAEAIAALAGADIDPQPFRPVLCGALLTGGLARYLRADISGGAGDDSTVSTDALWWPPNKLCGRYLAPYLSSQIGEAADVMPHDEGAIPVELADLPQPRGNPRYD